jgi:hypothetical protein
MVWILALINWTGITAADLNSYSYLSPTFEVSCLAPNCWQGGWTVNGQNNQHVGSAVCVNGSCEQLGWNFSWANGLQSHIVCKIGGCFLDGWDEKDSWGRVLSSTVCYGPTEAEGDCMRWGWETRFSNGGFVSTQCVNENCNQYGWNSTANNGEQERVRCKQPGCMELGWTIFH